jgi:hypothetical protein
MSTSLATREASRASTATVESFLSVGFSRIPLAVRFPLVLVTRTFDALEALTETRVSNGVLINLHGYAARYAAHQLARMSEFDYSKESQEFRATVLARRCFQLEQKITAALTARARAKEVTQ